MMNIGAKRTPCRVCRSISGHERISPGPVIHDGRAWMVEHAYPTSLVGWTVLVLKRHITALHDLTREEGDELGRLHRCVALALREATGCVKEYSVCYGEKEGFGHLHVHIVPVTDALGPDLRGGRIFAFLKPAPEEVLATEVVVEFCERLGRLVLEVLEEAYPTEALP